MPDYIPAAPEAPPQIQAQMQPPVPAPMGADVFMQAGRTAPAQPDVMAMLEQKVVELEQWASDMMKLTQVVHPPLAALLVPIAQAGKAIQSEVQQIKERAGQGGGLASGAPPAANPAEGVAPVTQ
jgi:hypothetical protein